MVSQGPRESAREAVRSAARKCDPNGVRRGKVACQVAVRSDLDAARPTGRDRRTAAKCSKTNPVDAGRREGDRQPEPEAARGARAIADHAVSVAEQCPRNVEVARGDGSPDGRAADRRAIEPELGHHRHLEATSRGASQLPEHRRRASSLVTERRIRGHDETGQIHPPGDPLDEHVVWGPSQPIVEVLDDNDLNTGHRQADESLARVEEERRRYSAENGVGMGVEGDDRRRGPPGRRLPDEPAQQMTVTAVESVEDPHGDGKPAMTSMQ
jgi:hypothetical protein